MSLLPKKMIGLHYPVSLWAKIYPLNVETNRSQKSLDEKKNDKKWWLSIIFISQHFHRIFVGLYKILCKSRHTNKNRTAAQSWTRSLQSRSVACCTHRRAPVQAGSPAGIATAAKQPRGYPSQTHHLSPINFLASTETKHCENMD